MQIALSVAGSDPTGGAGLQLDLQVFRSFGVHGAGVLTALTVQDTEKVHQVLPAFPSVVLDQLRALLRDLTPDAVKLGMLASDDVARSVALGLEELGAKDGAEVPVVIDPVLLASDGTPLLEQRGWPTLRSLIGRSKLTTPNLFEAGSLTDRDVSSRAGAEAAARTLIEDVGAEAVLVKGGHRDGDPDDLLAQREGDGTTFRWLTGERLPKNRVHGTGCALASAITALLSQGVPVEEAVGRGRGFVREAIARAEQRGRGAELLVFE